MHDEIIGNTESDAILAEIAERPSRLRGLRAKLNGALGRAAGARVGDVCLDYYNRTKRAEDPAGVLFPTNTGLDWAEKATLLGERRVFSRRSIRCLTKEVPPRIANAYSEGLNSQTECWWSEKGQYTVRFEHDIPVVVWGAEHESRILTRLSSHNFDGINIRGGKRAYREAVMSVSPVAVISDEFVGSNFCHWMLDWLPRFLLLREAGCDLREFSFVFGRPVAPFVRNSLKILGVNECQILQLNGSIRGATAALMSDHIVGVSSSGSTFRHALNGGDPLFFRLVRDMFPVSEFSAGENILVNHRGGCRLILDKKAKALLNKSGFKEVFMEDLSLLEQQAVFRGAKRIIAAHDAGLANLVFCQPGTKVLEVFSPVFSTSAFAILSDVGELDYSCAVGPLAASGRSSIDSDTDLLLSGDLLKDWFDT